MALREERPWEEANNNCLIQITHDIKRWMKNEIDVVEESSKENGTFHGEE